MENRITHTHTHHGAVLLLKPGCIIICSHHSIVCHSWRCHSDLGPLCLRFHGHWLWCGNLRTRGSKEVLEPIDWRNRFKMLASLAQCFSKQQSGGRILPGTFVNTPLSRLVWYLDVFRCVWYHNTCLSLFKFFQQQKRASTIIINHHHWTLNRSVSLCSPTFTERPKSVLRAPCSKLSWPEPNQWRG